MSSREPGVIVEREVLLKKLAECNAKMDGLDNMVLALEQSLAEVRAQVEYYSRLERDIKTEVHPTGVGRMMHGR
jgi:predicted  nucleic acid-binding Zn-ribbon protein